jgi:hypothetical protein
MNWGSVALWGFAATLVLTTLLAGSRAAGWTRIDVPFLLGTAISGNRDAATWIGALVHLGNGWVFAIAYAAAFESVGFAAAWFGALVGLVHALFVLTVGMTILPAFHPRMASEQDGPTPTRMLEPPGFLALHYGRQTPVATILAHLVYGAILGYFYRLN